MAGIPVTSSVKSWLQLVLEADPTWQQKRRTEPTYEFSNNRVFTVKSNQYSTP